MGRVDAALGASHPVIDSNTLANSLDLIASRFMHTSARRSRPRFSCTRGFSDNSFSLHASQPDAAGQSWSLAVSQALPPLSAPGSGSSTTGDGHHDAVLDAEHAQHEAREERLHPAGNQQHCDNQQTHRRYRLERSVDECPASRAGPASRPQHVRAWCLEEECAQSVSSAK
jgi:hypothetical protein